MTSFSSRMPIISLLIRYLAVGGASAVIEVLLFYGLHTLWGLELIASNIMAVSTVTLLGFIGQKRFTFQADGHLSTQAILYLVQLTLNFLLSNAMIFMFVQSLQLLAFQAKLLQLGLCIIFNFSFSKFVVFRPRPALVSRDNPQKYLLATVKSQNRP